LGSHTGACNNYTGKWFYDMEWGGCNRFWYGGCDPGRNHFDDMESCAEKCVSPRGSGVCYLKKVVGPCDGRYREWHYDHESKRCSQFLYSGCLGNGNRFLTKQECEDMCVMGENSNAVSVCDAPMAEGACDGNFTRWFYDQQNGNCQEFEYSGCEGNANRFMSEEECTGACRHRAKQRLTESVCKMYVENGNCGLEGKKNSTVARWGYDERRRRCVPFYFSGCRGNSNNFESKSACEEVCPTTFPPIIHLPRGSEVLAERNTGSVLLNVAIRANPPPVVKWIRNGVEISTIDGRYEMLADYSLHILRNVRDLDAGKYVVRAENGIGEAAEKTLDVVVYPLYTSAKIEIDKAIFAPESDVSIGCEVRGYPPPTIEWFKLSRIRGGRNMTQMEEQRPHVFIETYSASTVTTVSNLVLKNVTSKYSGNYMCRASSNFFPPAIATQGIRIQYGPGDKCVDWETYTHCDKVIEFKHCGNKYLGR
jgi:hypothetical protein